MYMYVCIYVCSLTREGDDIEVHTCRSAYLHVHGHLHVVHVYMASRVAPPDRSGPLESHAPRGARGPSAHLKQASKQVVSKHKVSKQATNKYMYVVSKKVSKQASK